MSNRLYIDTTHFINRSDGQGFIGARIYDDYDRQYINTWEEVPDGDLEVLKKILEEDDREIRNIIEFHVEFKKDICIDDTYYSYNEYKNYVKDTFDWLVE